MIMLSKHKAIHRIHCGMLLLSLLALLSASAFSREEGAAEHKLLVGVIAAPPVYMKTADNRWGGFGVEIWQAVSQDMGLAFEFREFNTLESMLTSLEKKEIDAIPAMAVQDRVEPFIDFSQSYLKSGLSIVVPVEGTEYRWMNVLKSIFSLQILKAVGLMFLMSLIIGIIVWSFEKRRNSEMFGDGNVKATSSIRTKVTSPWFRHSLSSCTRGLVGMGTKSICQYGAEKRSLMLTHGEP